MSRPADPNAKDALTAAARAEFAKKGLRGARVEDITAACGLSKGAFYLHFESKEGLFKSLVDAFMAEMAACGASRLEGMQRFLADLGPLTADDFRWQSERFQRFTDLECGEDLRTLEAMWLYRDVLDVLLSGCQGTPFERTIWELIDLEHARVAENHRQFQAAGCCRADVPAELFGSMIIGTYLLVGKRMAREQEKPDLALWARALHSLIHEGSATREGPAQDLAGPAGAHRQEKSKPTRSTRKSDARSTK